MYMNCGVVEGEIRRQLTSFLTINPSTTCVFVIIKYKPLINKLLLQQYLHL